MYWNSMPIKRDARWFLSSMLECLNNSWISNKMLHLNGQNDIKNLNLMTSTLICMNIWINLNVFSTHASTLTIRIVTLCSRQWMKSIKVDKQLDQKLYLLCISVAFCVWTLLLFGYWKATKRHRDNCIGEGG